MSELLEFLLELLDVIGSLLDGWCGVFESRDNLASRIFWGVILVLLAGIIWSELR